jgi:predicted PurR-regulated permease PerM
MLAQSLINGTHGVTVAIGLWLIGLTLGHGTPFPNVVLWGLLSALLRFVPYIGPWVAAAFPVVLSLVVYPGF